MLSALVLESYFTKGFYSETHNITQWTKQIPALN